MAHLKKEARGPRTVLNAGPFDCRWVTNRKTKTGFRIFCGKEATQSHKPYCEEHYRLVYTKAENWSELKV